MEVALEPPNTTFDTRRGSFRAMRMVSSSASAKLIRPSSRQPLGHDEVLLESEQSAAGPCESDDLLPPSGAERQRETIAVDNDLDDQQRLADHLIHVTKVANSEVRQTGRELPRMRHPATPAAGRT